MSCSQWAQAQQIQKVRLAKDSKAPFAGVLLTDAALAKIITDYEAKLKVAALDLERLKRDRTSELKTSEAVCKAKLEAADAKRQACLRDIERRDKLLTKAIDKCAEPVPWYKSPNLHFALGGLIVGGVCVAASRVD